jgi:hypothetical protein
MITERRPINEALIDHCPKCNLPYASHMSGFEHILSGMSVCQGSYILRHCRPVAYMCFPLPANSHRMKIQVDGRWHEGVLYQCKEEQT